MFHKHNWEKISDVVLPSAYEQIIKSGETIDKMRGGAAIHMFDKKHIVILKCTKCGKIQEIVNEN